MKAKRFFITLLVILVGFFGSKFILDRLEASQRFNINGNENIINDDAINKEEGQYLILLVGVDKNGNDDNTDFTRTDTIMLISADTKTGEMELMSIPRDSRVKIRDKFDKVNHAHAFGGIELTMQTLRQFLGLDIDYYVQVNYQALINIVDALGGVDYDVPEGINIHKGKVKINPGPNHLDGNEVMWYLRTRNIYNNGDIGRVNTQQAFVKAMVDEMVKKSKDMNLMTFISNYIKYVKTNLPMSAMLDLAGHINSFSSDKMSTHTVPGMEQTINGTSYWIPDYDKTWQIVDDSYSNFKLKNWKKEDSGYEEYKDFGQIEDQSQTSGIIEKKDDGQAEEAPVPETQTIPMQNNKQNWQAPAQNNNESYQAPAENYNNDYVDDGGYEEYEIIEITTTTTEEVPVEQGE
ncbi:LCP family protein [Anaerococcus sp. Marseille-Q7828]|uniref:LCP family protein n=1 Tax=Anaerococcus sp. Marseille-Q7828 TaxID=3036300 RepID=UPI0024ACFD52|nr:LCP family protein [Anaerococcus sp. Marseille-Q7828]